MARRMGLDIAGLPTPGWDGNSAVELMLDITQSMAVPLTAQGPFSWHAALFPAGWSDIFRFPLWNPGGGRSTSYRLAEPDLVQ